MAETFRRLAQNNVSYVSKHEQPRSMGQGRDTRPMAIVTCMDPRCNPTEFWNFQNAKGPAIIRNVGGNAMEALSCLRVLSALVGGVDCTTSLGAVAVIHHTDCGAVNFSSNFLKERIRDRAEGEEDKAAVSEMQFPVYTDIEESVRNDMAKIKSDPYLPKDLEVIGFVYDVFTGKTTEVGETGFTDAKTTCDLSKSRV